MKTTLRITATGLIGLAAFALLVFLFGLMIGDLVTGIIIGAGGATLVIVVVSLVVFVKRFNR